MYIRGINSRTIAPLLITSQYYGERMMYYKKLYYTYYLTGQITRIISRNHIIYTNTDNCTLYMTNRYCGCRKYDTITAVNDHKLVAPLRCKFISVFVIYNIHYDVGLCRCINSYHKYTRTHSNKFDF